MKCLIGFLLIQVLLLFSHVHAQDEQPTLYEYYTQPEITSGLSADQSYFTLNGKNITIFSGTFHYFRVHPYYWPHRLRAIRAAGLNTVETYLPWNLHQPQRDVFDFGFNDTDYSPFLDFILFLEYAQQSDLFVIVRPGPYICAEWEFGGLPSWILREQNMTVRSSDPQFSTLVETYFDRILGYLEVFQFKNGGPIIAVQIENEYAHTGRDDAPYLEYIRDLLIAHEFNSSLFVTSGPPNNQGGLPDILKTVNFQDDPQGQLDQLKAIQPDRPFMVMEYWTGWFDHWTENHHTRSVEIFGNNLEAILQYPASVNLYMFVGSSNWGFLNGANIGDTFIDNSGFQPTISSYDYDAPITEAGNLTDKYFKTKELIEKYNPIKLKTPDPPPEWIPSIGYENITVVEYLTLGDLLEQSENISSTDLVPMELLPINNNNGQSYGYIVYETTTTIPVNATLTIEGHVCDTVVVLINGTAYTKAAVQTSDLDGFGFWRQNNSQLALNNEQPLENANVQLLVENFGRNNFGTLDLFKQYKGLWQGDVLINDIALKNWTITPLEFQKKWTVALTGWRQFNNPVLGPAIYRGVLTLNETPQDTYFDLRNWQKGIVIVNGFVLSRHFRLGPQLSAYLPAPLLKHGDNTILIFDHYSSSDTIIFSDKPIFQIVS